jgi:hypothetical protein
LARILDVKRDEGTRGYTFIAPIRRFRVGNPGIHGWIRLRRRRSPARSRQEEETTDMRPFTSETPERGARAAVAPRPAHAGAGKSGQSSSASTAHQREKKGQAGSAGFQATGKR